MPVTICWSAKGGSGTTVVAAALALACPTSSLLVDLDGELPMVLGLPDQGGQGVADWLASDADAAALGDLGVVAERTTTRCAEGHDGVDRHVAALAGAAGVAGRRADAVVDAGTDRRRPSTSPPASAACSSPVPATWPLRRASRARRAPGRRRARRRARPRPGAPRRRAAPSARPWSPRSATIRPSPGPSTPGCSRPACPPRACCDAQLRRLRRERATSSSRGCTSDVDRRQPRRRAVPRRRARSRRHGAVVRAHVRRVAPLADRRSPTPGAGSRRPPRRTRRARAAPRRPRRRRGARQPRRRRLDRARRRPRRRRPRSPPADLAVVVERILAPLGRRVDRTSPIVDARLPDGSRVCAVVAPVAVDGACLAIRRFRDRALPAPRLRRRRRRRRARRAHRRPLQRRGQRVDVVAARPRCSNRSSAGPRRASASSPSRTPPSSARRRPPRAARGPAGHSRRRRRRSPSSSSCAPRCACDPTASSSARSAAPRSSPSSRPSTPATTARWSTCHANGALDALRRLETLLLAGRTRRGRWRRMRRTSPDRSTSSSTSPARRRRPAGSSRSPRSCRRRPARASGPSSPAAWSSTPVRRGRP